jgi:hypothetical protein
VFLLDKDSYSDKENIMKTGRIITLACFLIAPWAAAEQKNTTSKPDQMIFKLAYKTGKVTRYKLVNKTVGSMKMMEIMPEQKFTQTMEQVLVAKCLKVNPDLSAVLEVSMPRIRMKMGIGAMAMEFDSANTHQQSQNPPGTEIIRKMFVGMSKIKFRVTIGPDGKCQKMEGYKEGMAKIINDLKQEQMSELNKQMLDQMTGFMGDEDKMEEMFGYARMAPPIGPIGIGDKWDHDWKFRLGPLKTDIIGKGQYEIIGFETIRGRKCVKVKSIDSFKTVPKPQSATNDSAPAGNMMQAIFDRMNVDMESSDGKGVAYWDCQTGDLVQHRQTQRMTIEANMQADPNAEEPELQGGFSMIQKLNNAVSMDLLGENEPAFPAKAKAATQPAGIVK